MSCIHDLWLRYTLPKKTGPEVGVNFPVLDLSTRNGYVVAAAMRGPDQGEVGAIKSVFTARIRWLAGARNEEQYVSRESKIDIHTTRYFRTKVEEWGSTDIAGLRHYAQHIEDAAEVLGDKALNELAYNCRAGTLRDLSNEDIIYLAGGD